MAKRSSVYIAKQNIHLSVVDPGLTDDVSKGAYVGQQWLNTTSNVLFVCSSTAASAAVWSQLDSGYHALTIPVTFDQFASFAAVTGSVTLASLPAGAKVLSADIVQPAAMAHYAGPSITAVHMEVGITGTLAKYCALTDVFTAGQNLTSGGVAGYESQSVATNLLVSLVAIGANLNVLTAGEAWVNLVYVDFPIAAVV